MSKRVGITEFSRLYPEVRIKKTAGQKECAEKTEERCLVFFLRGGVRVFPQCNAPNSGLLHIIDFSLCAVISRLVR